MKTILITGVAGLVGANFANWIIKNKKEYTVIGIDNLFGGYREYVNSEVIFYQRDLSKDDISDIFEKYNPEYVFHFAAYAAEGLSPFIRKFNYENNIGSTVNIINNCINYDTKRLVYTSSMSLYGHPQGDKMFDEEDQPRPIDPYAISKYACEMDIKVAGEQHGLDWCIIRPHNCYSEDTEILTENGWKFFKDLEKTEKVLTLNPETEKMEYNFPTEYQKYYVDEDLYHFKSRDIDLLVTKDHNMVLKTNNHNKIQKITAEKIFSNPSKYYYYKTIKKIFPLIDDGKDDDIIIDEISDSLGRNMDNSNQNGGKKIIKAKNWFKFLGWFISEGCIYKTNSNYSVCISQYKEVNEKYYNEILDDIKNIGFNCYCNGNNIIINSKQLYQFLIKLFPGSNSHNKHIPREYFSYNKECLSELFDSLMKGDGNKNGKRYSTSSKQLSEDFSELCIKLGKRIRIFKETSKNNNIIYRCNFCSDEYTPLGDLYTKKLKCSKEHYTGYVYDITVPNHIIYVRRNGNSCWGSNCYGKYQNIWDKYRNVLGIWMNKILNSEPMLIYGDGEQVRAFSYIDDYMIPFWNAATSEKASKEIINVGGIYHNTLNEAAQILCDITGYDRVKHVEPRFEVKTCIPTFQKSIDLLDFKHTTSLKEGLIEMWEWAKNEPKREQFKWESYEINKGIYSYWK